MSSDRQATPEPRAQPSTPPPGVSLRRILVPAEHGSWGFLFEPILLGLLVAPSLAGLLIAIAAIGAFLARQPLKLLLGDRRKGKRYSRTVAAERAFALLAVAAAGALATALLHSEGRPLLALGLAAPLAALALALDLGQRSREMVTELLAPLALSATASAMALAVGWEHGPAFGLWAILAARAAPSVLFVRARLRLEKGEPSQIPLALVAQVLGLTFAVWLAVRTLVPWLGVAAIALLALRAAIGLSPWRPRITTRQLGFGELAYGILTVLAVAVGYWLARS